MKSTDNSLQSTDKKNKSEGSSLKADSSLTMADLLAKEDSKTFAISRGQELTGEVISILDQEIILDLGTKAEGVLPKKDLPSDQLEKLKVGDKLQVFVAQPENESGQVVLAFKRAPTIGSKGGFVKWDKFQEAINTSKTFVGKGLEVNKGGLIVEVQDIRGFLPSSQVSLSQAGDLSDLVGKEVTVTVIEADPSSNRLIFSQKSSLTEEAKEKLGKLKIGDKVAGKVAAVLPFGIFIALDDGVEGLVHISELAWEKVEDPSKLFKVGDQVSAQVISIDSNTNRVNLSVKQTTEDPFVELAKKYNKDDVLKGTVAKVSSMGVFVTLEDGLEGLIHSSKIDSSTKYEVGTKITVLVDNVDTAKRRVYLAPFITSTKDLIYK